MKKIMEFFYEDDFQNRIIKKKASNKYISALESLFGIIYDLMVFLFPYYILQDNTRIYKIAIQFLLISLVLNLILLDKIKLTTLLFRVLTPILVTLGGYIILLNTGIDVYKDSQEFIFESNYQLGYIIPLLLLIWMILPKPIEKLKKRIEKLKKREELSKLKLVFYENKLKRLTLFILILSSLVNIFLISIFDINGLVISITVITPNFIIIYYAICYFCKNRKKDFDEYFKSI